MNSTADRVASSAISLQPGDALIVIDVQRDYLPGGPMAVPGGDEVVEPLNRVIEQFVRADLPIFYVRDRHAANGARDPHAAGRSPAHCIADTPGAEFAPHLWIAEADSIIFLNAPQECVSSSAFQDTALSQRLQRTRTRRIFIGGLATEHCVKRTVFDALAQGYEVYVLLDAVRAANPASGAGKRALRVMRRQGAQTIATADVGGR